MVQRWDDKVPVMLESIIEQRYQNWELYLITSGVSKPKIEEYLKERNYDRGNIFCEVDENAPKEPHLSYQKYAAKSEFFFNIDGDDYLELDCLEKLVKAITESESDLAVCGIAMHLLASGRINDSRQLPQEFVLERSQYSTEFRKFFKFFRATWGILYRSSLFEDNVLLELPSAETFSAYGLDTIMTLALLRRTKKIVFAPGIGYHYMIWGGSVSNKFNKNREKADPLLYQHIEQFLLSLTPKINTKNRSFMADIHSNGVCDVTTTLINSDLSAEEKLEKYHYILTNEASRKAFSVGEVEYLDIIHESYHKNLIAFYDLKKHKKLIGAHMDQQFYEIFLVLWNLTEEAVSFQTYFDKAVRKNALLELIEEL